MTRREGEITAVALLPPRQQRTVAPAHPSRSFQDERSTLTGPRPPRRGSLCGGGVTAMTRRKGEITLPEIKRHWPHHVALSADKVRGVMNSHIVWSFAQSLSAAPRPYSLHR